MAAPMSRLCGTGKRRWRNYPGAREPLPQTHWQWLGLVREVIRNRAIDFFQMNEGSRNSGRSFQEIRRGGMRE